MSDHPSVQPIASHFCLSDGLTAALISSEGECDFWCAPRFDSRLRLAGILDSERGGSVGVRPLGAHLISAAWQGDSDVLLIRWSGGSTVRCSLIDDGRGGSAVAWSVEGPPGTPVRLLLKAGPKDPGWKVSASTAHLPASALADGPGGPLLVASSGTLRPFEDGAVTEISGDHLGVCLELAEAAGEPTAMARLLLGGGREAPATLARAVAAVAAESESWLDRLSHRGPLAEVRQRAPQWAWSALVRSLLTLRGLQDRGSGLLVASPLTSIPQWPGSDRSWDYRYAWLRDCCDAGMALVMAGALEEASRLARGLAMRLQRGAGRPVARLDGGELPPEHVLSHLRGYQGGTVRIGNAAEGQAQVDTLGEVLRFIEEIDSAAACPPELLHLAPDLACEAARRWAEPDHGIWEVRGAPQHYLHSKVMAWAALDCGLRLAGRGRIASPAANSWEEARSALQAAVRSLGTITGGALKMAFDDQSADSATLAAYLTAFIDPSQPAAAATLDFVTGQLEEWPLLARHRPERDGIPSPCAPFIFPSLWAVIAEARLGRQAEAHRRLLAIVELAGPAGQLSEVAIPEPPRLLGNYPQVQSHAAMVQAVVELFGGRRRVEPDRSPPILANGQPGAPGSDAPFV